MEHCVEITHAPVQTIVDGSRLEAALVIARLP